MAASLPLKRAKHREAFVRAAQRAAAADARLDEVDVMRVVAALKERLKFSEARAARAEASNAALRDSPGGGGDRSSKMLEAAFEKLREDYEKRPRGARARAARDARARRYVDNGWRDEGFESPVEKECVDWINTKPDCSLEVVLKHNPDLAEKLKHGKPTNWALKKDWERQQDQRRGKFI